VTSVLILNCFFLNGLKDITLFYWTSLWKIHNLSSFEENHLLSMHTLRSRLECADHIYAHCFFRQSHSKLNTNLEPYKPIIQGVGTWRGIERVWSVWLTEIKSSVKLIIFNHATIMKLMLAKLCVGFLCKISSCRLFVSSYFYILNSIL